MFPFRTTSIFRSRWIALFWAAGIIWTAVDYAGHAPKRGADGNTSDTITDESGAPVDEAQLNQAAHLLSDFGK